MSSSKESKTINFFPQKPTLLIIFWDVFERNDKTRLLLRCFPQEWRDKTRLKNLISVHWVHLSVFISPLINNLSTEHSSNFARWILQNYCPVCEKSIYKVEHFSAKSRNLLLSLITLCSCFVKGVNKFLWNAGNDGRWFSCKFSRRTSR